MWEGLFLSSLTEGLILFFLVHEGSNILSSFRARSVLLAFDVVDQPDWNGIMIARRPQSIRRDTRGQVGDRRCTESKPERGL